MDDNTIPCAVAETTSRKRRIMISAVWIIPALAAIIAIIIVVGRIINEGPTITITFKTAEGIEAGKTFIKYKSVNIGYVTKISLSEDYTKVVVTAKMEKNIQKLLVKDAKFWLVQPQISLSGVSGIDTLLTGNYIGFEAGKSSSSRRDFKAMDAPPLVVYSELGKRFTLIAPNLDSLDIGSPLYYRHIQAGRVIGYSLKEDGSVVEIQVFIKAPYDDYVKDETRFWRVSGIDMSLSPGGFSLKTHSILSMLLGGISFENPPFAPEDNPQAQDGAAFTLFENKAIAMTSQEDVAVHYTIYFRESVRGLVAKAPVTLYGIEIGEVVSISLDLDEKTTRHDTSPRVDIVIYPKRFITAVKNSPSGRTQEENKQICHVFLKKLIDRGLRAQLRVGNLLLGQRFIILDFFPHAAPATLSLKEKVPRFPETPSELVDIEDKMNRFLAKIESFPLDTIGKNMEETLTAISKAAADINKITERFDAEIMPEAKQTMEDLRKAIAAAESILKTGERDLFSQDAPAHQELREALQEIAKAARTIASFTEYLERNPSSLFRGKGKETQK